MTVPALPDLSAEEVGNQIYRELANWDGYSTVLLLPLVCPMCLINDESILEAWSEPYTPCCPGCTIAHVAAFRATGCVNVDGHSHETTMRTAWWDDEASITATPRASTIKGTDLVFT